MNPLAIKARNYRTFETLDLDLPVGCVAILGANGAGKSSVANVVDLALFGPDGRSWAPYLTQGTESTELMLELVFEHGEAIYRVRRGYSARGSGKTTLDLEVARSEALETWTPLTLETAKLTQAYLETLLGMTRETFRASSMLVQGDGAAFTEAAPADRKRVLAKILGLDRYDRLADFAKRDRKAAEAELQKIAGRLEVAESELATRDERVRERDLAATLLADAERTLALSEEGRASIAQEIAAAEDLSRQRAAAREALTLAESKLSPLAQRSADADEAAPALAIVREEIDSLPTSGQIEDLEAAGTALAGRIEAHRQDVLRAEEAGRARGLAESQREAMLAQATAKANEAAALASQIAKVEEGHLDSCPTCAQALGADAKAATLSSLRARCQVVEDEALAIRERADAVVLPEIPKVAPLEPGLEEELVATRERFRQARDSAVQKARLEERAANLQKTLDARPADEETAAIRSAVEAAEKALDDLPALPADLDERKVEVVSLEARIRTARAQIEDIGRRLAVHEAALERLAAVEQETAGARDLRSSLQRDVDELSVLERAYGRDGIPALIIGQAAIPSIEAEAGRILGELGTSYRVELRTEKALATGAIADALDVVVVTEDGERPYETFSGGERTRINLALRVGLARLLAHRRGAESRLLVIDEPEYLDQAGTAALATVLRGLTGDFDRIYLISHVPELRDAALDSVLEVTRSETGYSQIGGSA